MVLQKYRRTHDSSTISPRPSMTGSERKLMDGEGRSENQRANSFLDVLVLGDLPDVYIPEQMPGANLVPSANRVYVKMKHENRHSRQKKLRLVFSFEVEA